MTRVRVILALALLPCAFGKVISNSLFLAENAQLPGWTTTASGLQYKVLKSGTGPAASPSARVVATYTARLPHNGQELPPGTPLHRRATPTTPAYGAPALVPNRVMKGLAEALGLMRAGDAWELVVPPKLAYGAAGSGTAVPPNAILLWTVEVAEVRDGSAAARAVAVGLAALLVLRRYT